VLQEEEFKQKGQAQDYRDTHEGTPGSTSVDSVESIMIHTRGQISAYAGLGLSMSLSLRKHFFSTLILGLQVSHIGELVRSGAT
jgi:hypothetical protein